MVVYLIVLVALGLLPVSTTSAQPAWESQENVYQLDPYFLNGEYGYLYSNIRGNTGFDELDDVTRDTCRIYRTTDSGKTWVATKDYSDMFGQIRGMHFATSSRGYVAVSQSINLQYHARYKSGGIYETIDSGVSWKRITPIGYGYDAVYAFGDTIIATATTTSDYLDIPNGDNTAFSGIMRTTDRGKTWKIVESDYRTGFDLADNGFGFIVSSTAFQDGPPYIVISTDFGATWKPRLLLPFGMGMVYVPKGTRYIFGLMGDSIMRSMDGGDTWETCYRTVTGTADWLAAVEGAGCVVYVQTYKRMLRSTDWGATWKDLGLFPNSTSKGLSVVGNGAIVFAKQSFGAGPFKGRLLWHTTTGGDNSLSPEPKGEEITIASQLHSSVSLPSPQSDTIRTKLCDSASINVQFAYSADCNRAWLSDLRLIGYDTTEYDRSVITHRDLSGKEDSGSIVIRPSKAGAYTVQLRVRFEQDDHQLRDTLFPLVLIVESNPSVLSLNAKPQYDLGFQRLCDVRTVTDSFSVSALGCEAYAIRSIRFEDDNTNSGYSFPSVSDLILPPDGSKRYFTLSFRPNRPGTFTGRIIVEREDKIDTFYVTASAADDDRQLVLRADTMVTQMCESSEGLIELTNTSCRLITIDELRVPAPLELLPNQVPIGVQAGKSVQLRVRYTPDAEGPKQVDALGKLRFVGQSETVAFDTILPLNVYGLPGDPLTHLTDTSINIGDVSICSEKVFDIHVESFGCDTLSVSAADLTLNDQGFTIVSQPTALVPQGESTNVGIQFVPPAVGQFTTDLIVTTNAGTRRITLIGNGVRGTRTLASSLSTIDFGETNICEELDSVISLTNTGCDTLTITDADIDKNFSLDVDLPITLLSNQSVELPITTRVDTTGKPTILTGLLTVTSNADNQLAPITLVRRLYYPTKLRIEAIDEASGKAGDITKFRIILDGDVPSSMTALHFDFLHNNDLLSFESLDGAGLSIARTQGETDQRQSFTLTPVRAGVLGELTFKAYLAEAEQTTLSFDNIRFDAEGISFAPECIAVISDSGSRFNYVYTCGDDMTRNALRGQTLIKSLAPNPAQNEIRLELANGVGEAQVVIVDMLGKGVLSMEVHARMDVSQINTGIYFIRVLARGSTETRRLILIR